MSETKKWVKVGRNAKGEITVRVTLQRDNVSANWAVKAFTNDLVKGLREATAGAESALKVMIEAMQE